MEERYGADDSDSESSEAESEDDVAAALTPKVDSQIDAVLQAIRTKDPRIYDPKVKWYDSPDEDGEPAAQKKQDKPVYLRDYHRERYMRGDTGAENEDNSDEGARKTYGQEQDDLKRSLIAEINAAAGDGSGGDGDESDADDFMKPKEVSQPNENGVHPSRAARLEVTDVDVANAHKDPDAYLQKYMAAKAWLPREGAAWKPFDSDEEDDEDDVDLAEQFESAYNLRFEDPTKSNEVLKSYSRTLVDSRSVRREEKKGRKRQRELEKEKREAEKRERKDERSRLKKLKMDEMHEKLKKIKKAAGMGGKELRDDEWAKLLDNAWENDHWEEEMNKTFGEQYYAEADDVEGSDQGDAGPSASRKKARKPKWDDDIDINDIVPDFEDQDAGPTAALTDSETDRDQDEDEPAAKKQKTSKDRKRDRADAKRVARVEHAKIEALVDTRMELDDPASLAAVSPAVAASSSQAKARFTPFRYRETSPTSFGLTPTDILMAPSDAALNEFAGLKKLATFRDAQKKSKDKKRLGKKARLRQWRRENFGKEFERTGPRFVFGGHEAPAGADEAGDDGEGRGAKKKKRKRSKGKGKGAAA